MRSLIIVDYGSGNLHSVQQSVRKVADEQSKEWVVKVSSNPKEVSKADYIILPGVGNFADCKKNLLEIKDMVQVLEMRVQQCAAPFLGICVGMQLMATNGLEGKYVSGLNWINGEVLPLNPRPRAAYKIPHMGWNKIKINNTNHSFSSQFSNELFYYFVHSYHFVPENVADCLAFADYGQKVTAIIAKDNKIGTQFHPEKSQKAGLKLLSSFLNWNI